jgi:hypothetical protein
MKLFTILAGLVLTSNIATATSLHPCTPNYRAQGTIISCKEGNVYYSIDIQTLMSPPSRMCQGENYYTHQTATVTVLEEGRTPKVFELQNGEFSYVLRANHAGASFQSEKYNFNLNNCVTPVPAGFSVGN